MRELLFDKSVKLIKFNAPSIFEIRIIMMMIINVCSFQDHIIFVIYSFSSFVCVMFVAFSSIYTFAASTECLFFCSIFYEWTMYTLSSTLSCVVDNNDVVGYVLLCVCVCASLHQIFYVSIHTGVFVCLFLWFILIKYPVVRQFTTLCYDYGA